MTSKSASTLPSTLEQLRRLTTIVADTGDFETLEKYQPQDATTNPTHILAASKLKKYSYILDNAVEYAKSKVTNVDEQVDLALLRLLVGFGCEILKHVPGRVSTEVDAACSFDTASTIQMARNIIKLYEELGVPRDRVLIKIVSTWEGLQAARVLERDGIKCNLTLLFSLPQAILAAEANVTLISPFVGRSMDWWHKNLPGKDYSGSKDPGVKLVADIYKCYRKRGFRTEIMAASLRSIDECVHLAGIDLMTIAVGLLDELSSTHYHVEQRLDSEVVLSTIESATVQSAETTYLENEAGFRMDLFQDIMATDKIAEGLRTFLKDGADLKSVLKARLIGAA